MFEKDKMQIMYLRDDFTYCEKLYDKYLEMRKVLGDIETLKYGKTDPILKSEDFKQGFIAGVKIMSSMLMDL